MADPLSTTASLIAVGQVIGSIISCCYNYQQSLKSARKEASRILLETQTLRNVIERLLDQVTDDESNGGTLLPSLARMLNGTGSVFEHCSQDLAVLEERLRTPVNKWRKLGGRLLWPLRESEIIKEVETIHRLRSVIESGLAVDTAASVREIQKDTRELKERVLDFQRAIKLTDHQRLQVMLDWLGAPDPSAHHNMVLKGRTEGTGVWLLKGAEFEAWRDSSEMSVLWMHGIPGCGKSVLTSSVIDHLRQFTSTKRHVSALGYYYFQFSHKDTSTMDLMLRSLIYQLSYWKGSPPTELAGIATRHFSHTRYHDKSGAIYKEGVSQPSTSELVSILRGITEELDEVFLVLDGLDECVDQEDLLGMVDEVLRWNVEGLHIFLTGRFDQNLGTTVEAMNVPTVQVNEQAVKRDIELFVEEQLTTHPRLRKWSPKLRDQIRGSLITGSQGMFRWVACQIDVIAKCVTPRDLMKTLSSLPKSLAATYTSILAQVDELQWEYTIKILIWLAVSSQPLKIEEAVDALAIDFEAENGPSFDPDLRLQDVGDIIAISSTLVTPCQVVVQRDQAVEEFTELRLAHHTVKDYLLSDVFEACLPHPNPFVRKAQAYEFAAKGSIAYLLSLSERLDSASLDEWPFSQHAARFWLEHYVGAGNNRDLTSHAMRLLAFNGNTEPYRNWCRLYDPTRPWRGPGLDRDSFPDPLYYASDCGVESLVSKLLEQGSAPAMRQGEVHASCLQSAAYNGHYRIAQLLLEAGVDPNAGGGFFDSPLKAATTFGHNSVLELLLEHGADPDGRDSLSYFEGTALLEACKRNNIPAVKLLLDAGASPDRYSRKGSDVNPLEAAASRGFQECLKLLLPKASRITILRGLQVASTRPDDPSMLNLFKDKVPDAVLHHAIAHGLNDLAGEILDGGVTRMDIDRSNDRDRYRDIMDYSPSGMLYRACETGNLEAAQRLVQEGVDINSGDETYGPSLAVAAYKGRLDIVEMLIESGCSLTNGDGIYGGPVQAAVLGNHLEVLEFLVSAGADINMPVGKAKQFSSNLPLSGSPLQAATAMANEVMVDWLVNRGANVNYGAGNGCTSWGFGGEGSSLLIAASQGHLSLVNRLLQANADVNQRTGEDHRRPSTPLEAACKNNRVTVVERLLKAGAAIESNNCPDESGSPLFWAVKTGSVETVELLLKNGADPNALRHSEKGRRTVLSQACKGVKAEIVSALVEAGADVHKTSRFADDDESPIQTAVRHSSVDVIRVLLKYGANVNDQTSEGFTALHKAARRGCADILHALLSEDLADYSLRLINGSQPIHSAARWNQPDCIQMLVEAGADINSRNNSGKTPLHWATENHGADAVQWLLSNGADAGLAEYETNLTPHDYAVLMLDQADFYMRDDATKVLELLRENLGVS